MYLSVELTDKDSYLKKRHFISTLLVIYFVTLFFFSDRKKISHILSKRSKKTLFCKFSKQSEINKFVSF